MVWKTFLFCYLYLVDDARLFLDLLLQEAVVDDHVVVVVVEEARDEVGRLLLGLGLEAVAVEVGRRFRLGPVTVRVRPLVVGRHRLALDVRLLFDVLGGVGRGKWRRRRFGLD